MPCSATTCDLRAPAPLRACRCTRSRSHRTQPCKHAHAHGNVRPRFPRGATKRTLPSETIVTMVKGTGNTPARDTWFQRPPPPPSPDDKHRHEKGNKGSARPLDLAREKRELLLHFSERFTTTLCRASFVSRPFRVAAWEFKMRATSRRHNLADDDELCWIL